MTTGIAVHPVDKRRRISWFEAVWLGERRACDRFVDEACVRFHHVKAAL